MSNVYWEDINIILYTLYQVTLDTGLLIRPVLTRHSHQHTHTCPSAPTISCRESQVSCLCPVSTCGNYRDKQKRFLFDKRLMFVWPPFTGINFRYVYTEQGVVAAQASVGVAPRHCPCSATTGLVSTSHQMLDTDFSRHTHHSLTML